MESMESMESGRSASAGPTASTATARRSPYFPFFSHFPYFPFFPIFPIGKFGKCGKYGNWRLFLCLSRRIHFLGNNACFVFFRGGGGGGQVHPSAAVGAEPGPSRPPAVSDPPPSPTRELSNPSAPRPRPAWTLETSRLLSTGPPDWVRIHPTKVNHCWGSGAWTRPAPCLQHPIPTRGIPDFLSTSRYPPWVSKTSHLLAKDPPEWVQIEPTQSNRR